MGVIRIVHLAPTRDLHHCRLLCRYHHHRDPNDNDAHSWHIATVNAYKQLLYFLAVAVRPESNVDYIFTVHGETDVPFPSLVPQCAHPAGTTTSSSAYSSGCCLCCCGGDWFADSSQLSAALFFVCHGRFFCRHVNFSPSVPCGVSSGPICVLARLSNCSWRLLGTIAGCAHPDISNFERFETQTC